MLRRKLILSFIAVFVLLSLGIVVIPKNQLEISSHVFAQTLGTSVSGYISEDTIWRIDDSPYLISSDIIIETNAVVTLEPGVVVKFVAGNNIIVDGGLVARGNSTHPITFTSSSATPVPGMWGSIIFRDESKDSSCEITHCLIEYGTNGISAISSEPTISFCNISDNSGYGIEMDDGAPEISWCLLNRNNIGIHVAGIYSSPVITDNEIKNNKLDGVFCDWVWGWSGQVRISGNNISLNEGNGIKTVASGNILITNNIISDNHDSGILLSDLDIEVRGNVIMRNKYGIYSSAGDQEDLIPIRYNHIAENSVYDFYHDGSADVTATLNWWGTTNETLIREHIYDYYDDWNFGKVFYDPYLMPPIANFTYFPHTPFEYQTVTFDGSDSFNNIGSIEGYEWDFGDGTTTVTSSPVIDHVYEDIGTYSVNLTVTNEYGLTNGTIINVTIFSDEIAPVTSHDYDGVWHTSDFTITLSATDSESGVADTYYRINHGEEQLLATSGQPQITLEGANNTLEYWSVDNAYNEELPHKNITNIKLDKTCPAIDEPTKQPSGDVLPDQNVNISATIIDLTSGVENATLSITVNNGNSWTDLPMIYDAISGMYYAIIPNQAEHTQVKYKILAYDNAGNTAISDNAGDYYIYEVIPEYSSLFITSILLVATLVIVVNKKKLLKKRTLDT